MIKLLSKIYNSLKYNRVDYYSDYILLTGYIKHEEKINTKKKIFVLTRKSESILFMSILTFIIFVLSFFILDLITFSILIIPFLIIFGRLFYVYTKTKHEQKDLKYFFNEMFEDPEQRKNRIRKKKFIEII